MELCYQFNLEDIDVFAGLGSEHIKIAVIISPEKTIEIIVDKTNTLSIYFDTENFNDLETFIKMCTTIKIES